MKLEMMHEGAWGLLEARVKAENGYYVATIVDPPFEKADVDLRRVEMRLDGVAVRQVTYQGKSGLGGARVVVVWLLLEGE